jgi:hypothetical protein
VTSSFLAWAVCARASAARPPAGAPHIQMVTKAGAHVTAAGTPFSLTATHLRRDQLGATEGVCMSTAIDTRTTPSPCVFPDPPTVMHLRQMLRSHQRRVDLLGRRIPTIEPLRTGGAALLARWTAPRGFDQQWPDSTAARVRASLFDAAIARGDIITALEQRGPLRQWTADEPLVLRILHELVAANVASHGIAQALGWLDDFRRCLDPSTPTGVLVQLACLVIEDPAGCTCREASEAGDSDWYEIPSLAWLHSNHQLWNGAVWEMLAADPAVLRATRRALLADLRVPDRGSPEDEPAGRHLDRCHGAALRDHFARADPDPLWVGAHR